MKDKFFITMVAVSILLAYSCKSGDEVSKTSQNNNTVSQQGLPPEFLKESQGLSSQEVQEIYAYAGTKADLMCQKTEVEINTHKHNAEKQKEKNNQLERDIYELQQEIDAYLINNKRKKAYQEAYNIEISKCKWAKEAGFVK